MAKGGGGCEGGTGAEVDAHPEDEVFAAADGGGGGGAEDCG